MGRGSSETTLPGLPPQFERRTWAHSSASPVISERRAESVGLECGALPIPPLDQLYRSHGSAILRRARAMLGSETEAQEVLHDVFASLLQNPGQFRGHSSIMTFLYRVTTNAALQRLRNHRTRQRLLERHLDPERDVLAQGQEAHSELRELVRRLPEDLAQLAVYYYLDEMTQDEIASVLGCSRQWVGKLLVRLHEHVEESQ